MTDWSAEEQRAEENALFENRFAKSETRIDDAAAAAGRIEQQMIEAGQVQGDVGGMHDVISIIAGILVAAMIMLWTEDLFLTGVLGFTALMFTRGVLLMLSTYHRQKVRRTYEIPTVVETRSTTGRIRQTGEGNGS